MAADETAKTSISQTIVLFILPAGILGFLAVALFFDFLGTQATEIAKLINEIEIKCKSDLLGRLGVLAPTDPSAGSFVTCAHYLPRIGMFFALLALWLIVANLVTLKLFEIVRRRDLRFLIAALTGMLLPVIMLYKYWSVIPVSLGLGGGFPAFTVLVILETAAIEGLYAYGFFRSPDRPQSAVPIGTVFFGSIVVFVALSLLFAYYPINLFNYVGSTNTMVLYALLAYGFLGGLFYYGRQTGVPFAGILLIWIIVIDALGVTHGNTVPTRAVTSTQPKGEQQLSLIHI